MVDRLSIITTRTGDQGTTGLGDGSRVAKNDVRVHALGDVDELNSVLGVVAAYAKMHHELDEYAPILNAIQHALFDLGSELAVPGFNLALDAHITEFNGRLTPLKEFILPGGSTVAAHMHVARSVCRRAERAVVNLDSLGPLPKQYLNRLSDLLFILARCVNLSLGLQDVMWQRQT